MKVKKSGLRLPRYTAERAQASCGCMTILQATEEHLAALKARLAEKRSKVIERPACV
jgi:hypothetical protein